MHSYFTRPISVALLDDHYVVLHGMKNILSEDSAIHVVGSFTKSEDLLSYLQSAAVDVIVMDFELAPSDVDGLGLLGILRRNFSTVPVLVVSAHYNAAVVAAALRVGARGFIGKIRPSSVIHKALSYIIKGRIFIEPEMAHLLASQQHYGDKLLSGNLNQDNVNQAASLASLSPKELEVVRCYLTGMKVGEIAEKFNRSKKTVSGHKQNAMRKLGLKADHELFIIKDELLKIIQL